MRFTKPTVIIASLALFVFASCEDALTPRLQETVRVASLPTRMLTIQPPSDGTVAPSGETEVKEGEPYAISATPNNGFTFINWEQTGGDGTVAFDDSTAASTSVTLRGGDATIRAVISNAPRTLTVENDGNGSTTPPGTVTVGDGVARNIEAIPAAGYEFDGWAKTGGAGTVSFANNAATSTTVTVTGGDATIRASFVLKTYTITIDNTAGGSVSSSSINVTHGVESGTITAVPITGYDFAGWTVTDGSGLSFNPGTSSSSIRITATGGNAAIRANFALKEYTLSIAAGSGGRIVGGSGVRTVQHGVPFDIEATPYSTYVFDGWAKTAGTGSVTFADATGASTNVIVTGGNAQITASFRKEAISLTKVAELAFSNCCTTYPEDVDALYDYGDSIYVAGWRWDNDSEGVIREVLIGNRAAPSLGANEYVTGRVRDMTGSGNTVFVSTSANLYKFNGLTLDTSQTYPSGALATDRYGRDVLWTYRTSLDEVSEYSTSGLSGSYFRLLDSFGQVEELLSTAFGAVVSITESDGRHRLNTYDLDGVSGATVSAPDDYVDVHTGGSMDPGDAGPMIQDVDGEYLFLYAYEPFIAPNHRIHFYDVTDGGSFAAVGSPGYISLSGVVNSMDVDDHYIYAAGDNGSSATVTIVDVYQKTSPAIRLNETIGGFDRADGIVVRGDHLYVFLDNDTGSPKPTLYVYEITRN
jgi:hypothetical protein